MILKKKSEAGGSMVLPLFVIKNDVLLPFGDMTVDLAAPEEGDIFRRAEAMGGLLAVAPVSADEEGHFDARELDRKIGLIAAVEKIETETAGKNGAENGLHVHLRGYSRCRLLSTVRTKDGYDAALVPIENELTPAADAGYLKKELGGLFGECVKFMPKREAVIAKISRCDDLSDLVDLMASALLVRYEDKIDILEELSPVRRAELLAFKLQRDLRIVQSEIGIHQKVKERLDENQRQYYMREQYKVLQEELGEEEGQDEEIMEYLAKIEAAGLPETAAERLVKETNKLAKMPYASAEATVIRGYIDAVLELPWHNKTKDRLDLAAARRILDKEHWGLKDVKERIVEFLAVEKLTDRQKSQILCFVGAPGVGKTSVASSIAHAMNRKFVRVALGGVRDESDIRGHRKTYIGSMPGRIMAALTEAGTSNPVILLDEVDKLTRDAHGDPASALLEVLDPDQNKAFRDHFIELPFDLSDCLFIATANTLETVPRPLLDRMEVIELKTYTRTEKLEIAKAHLIPKVLEKNGLPKRYVRIRDEAVLEIIDHYTREAGVRNLERELSSVARKIACHFAEEAEQAEKSAKETWANEARANEARIDEARTQAGHAESKNGAKNAGKESAARVFSHIVTVNADDVKTYLGAPKFIDDPALTRDEVGVVNGLAYTEAGGELLRVEAAVMEGSGKLELTGSLGDVMKESAQIARSLVRVRAEKYHLPADFYKTKDIHVHFPEGAVPKDGPSAGVTLVTALVSRLSGCPVRHDIAMTGEVTLSGRVLAIGGLREKTMAAYKNGIRRVLIPYDNRRDVERMEEYIKDNVTFVLCKTVDEVLDLAIVREEGLTVEPRLPVPPLGQTAARSNNEAEFRAHCT